MTRNLLNDIPLDDRKAKDIRKEIAEKAAFYTPEWVFDEKNPDAGSVIGHIFANQFGSNVERFNQIFDKYGTEFVNILGISLMPASPARGIVSVDLISDTVEGVEIHKGTKFVGHGETEETERVIFESVNDVYVTNSRLKDIFMVSGVHGKIVPVMGDMKSPEYIEELEAPEEPSTGEEQEEFKGMTLFDFTSDGIQKNGVVFLAEQLFDTNGESIKLSFRDRQNSGKLNELFSDETRFTLSYYTDEGFTRCESVVCAGSYISIKCNKEKKAVKIHEKEYKAFLLEAVGPVKEPYELFGVDISSECKSKAPRFIINQNEEQTGKKIYPFGDSLALYEECYFGCDEVFKKAGSKVTVRFNISYEEKLMTFSPEQEKEKLKPIKRKPKLVTNNVPANSRADLISIEYFNGKGFVRLPVSETYKTLFDGSYKGDIEFSFACPIDWEPYTVGGFEERTLRIQLVKADNCYMQPCFHLIPVLQNVSFAYTYDENWMKPDIVRCVSGVSEKDITKDILLEKPVTVFAPLNHESNAVYFGFDKPFAKAPISILLNIGENGAYEGEGIRYEYSCQKGFKQMKVIDHTYGLSSSGTLVFVPPADMLRTKIFGKNRYWIRVVDGLERFNNPKTERTTINEIIMNAIEVMNVETLEEEDYFIDSSYAGMSFPINADNILDAEVYVNEVDTLTISAMREMADSEPENVRVMVNQLGEITSFFVKWTEVDDFFCSEDGARHYRIDRLNKRIVFGDGVGAKLPTFREGVGFTMKVRCCDGSKANLPKESIDETAGNILYINNILNPIATFAGSDMEDQMNARARGASILSSGNRLVSKLDFIREVSSFSQAIEKVSCIIDTNRYDKINNNTAVYIVILMKDYREGVYSFNLLRDRLHKYLLTKCEETIRPEDLIICEPTYVTLDVDVWVDVSSIDGAFDIQNSIADGVRDYIDPIEGTYAEERKIGDVPSLSQIRMLLYSLSTEASISNFTVTASYSDENGFHSCDLSELKTTPFMIAINGKHNVIININN